MFHIKESVWRICGSGLQNFWTNKHNNHCFVAITHISLRSELEDFVGAKVYCLHDCNEADTGEPD